MNTALDKISHKAQRVAASVIIDKVLAMVDKDREKGFLELVDWHIMEIESKTGTFISNHS